MVNCSGKKALYLSVNVFSTKVRLLLETGPPFYVVIRATRRSSCLQDKGTVVASFFSYFKTLSVGPATSRSTVKRSTVLADLVGLKIRGVTTCYRTKYLTTYSAFFQGQIKSFRFWREDDYEYEISSILSIAQAWTSVSLAGKLDSRRHCTTSFSENVVLAGTSYQM